MVAQEHKDRLQELKKEIEAAYIYFKPNYTRFHEFQKFVFMTALSYADEDTLKNMGKPVLEFNISNAPVSRLCGEFSKQEPSIYVTPAFGMPLDEKLLEVVEGHIRHILFEAHQRNVQYTVHRDQLSGGFSDFKVWTEYASNMSFDQVIKFGRVYEPTMTGFDPLAREVDKSDARYCFEIYPMAKKDFKAKYPDVDVQDLDFSREEMGFSWSYKTDREDVVVLVDFYERKKRRKKIVKLADDRVMSKKEYEDFLADFEQQGFIQQAPAIVDERWAEVDVVMRYKVMGTEVLEAKETEYKYLPLVFVDGDSVIIQDTDHGNMQQFCKPYVYHAKGIQRLTNFAGQVIANDFENLVMHKFMVAKESIPQEKEYQDAYENVQIANTLVYNAYDEFNPDRQLPPPREVARVPLPQEVLTTFNTSMQMLQNILGSYDAALGINDNQLSGVAIVEAATQSNAAAMPYIVNYMQSLNQVAKIIIDLIPKYYKTPRTIPIVTKDGKRSFVKVNQPGEVMFNYDENALNVKVEAGVNFNIAKNKALQQIIALMNASPLFAQFINAQGLDILLDNMEFRGVDVIKAKADKFMQQLQQQQAQSMNQPSPEQMQAQIMQQQVQVQAQQVQQRAQEAQGKLTIDMAKVANDKAKVDNDRLALLQKAGESQAKFMVDVAKAEAEENRAQTDLAIKHLDVSHKHQHNAVKLAHEVIQGEKQHGENEKDVHTKRD